MAREVTVEVTRTGRRFEATAMLDLAADAQTVWDTITDYGGLPRFMPGIRACRVRQREAMPHGDERLVVEQEGEFRFLLFSQAMTVVLGIENRRLRVSEAKAVAFWGSIDEQHTLPFGSADDVQNEILHRLQTIGKSGGLILGPTHHVQLDTPMENFWAMVNAITQTPYRVLDPSG